MNWSAAPLFVFIILGLAASLLADDHLDEDQEPTVMVALFVRNKAHLLDNTLKLLENQDYPKHRISIYLRSDHNEDATEAILKRWIDHRQSDYHSVDVIIGGGNNNSKHPDQASGPLQWSSQRFRHIMRLKEDALEKARHIWADWIWFLDADAFLVNPMTLRLMVARSHFTIVGPMLTSVGLYSNFWAGMTDNYYYKRTDEYKPILDRNEVGCHNVPMVHSSVLVNLNRRDSAMLTFIPEKISNYDGPEDDIITFALSAAFNDIGIYVCNDVDHGYIMLPLDDDQNLKDDIANLSNLKMQMYAYGHRLPVKTDITRRPRDTLGADHVYLINLERRPDRRSNMEAILEELQIEYEWLKAMDGRVHINEGYMKEHGIEMMKDFSEPYHGRPMTFGEIGCFMSHYNIWKDVIDSGYNEVIVFEDDVRFEPFFRQKLSAVRAEIAQLDVEWDLIFLGRKILHNVEEDWVEDSKWLLHVNYTYWTLGYMLNQSGAQKLVNEQPLGKMVPVDEYLPIMYDKHPNQTWKSHYENRNLKAYSVHPLLLFPTHYTGEEGYFSDTEDTPVIAVDTDHHDEL